MREEKQHDPGRFAVDLDGEIASRANVRMVEADISGEGYLVPRGQIDDFWYVIVNASADLSRRRFTIAHELGHHTLETREARKPKDEEEWCNRYAGELLLPQERVFRFMAEAKSVHQWDCGPREFDVSRTTFWTRLWDFGIIRLKKRNGKVSAPGLSFILKEYKNLMKQNAEVEELSSLMELFDDGDKVLRVKPAQH